MSAWKDCTSYCRGEERNPAAWEAVCGHVRLVVTKGHRGNPGFWTMHAYGLNIDTFDLKLPDAEPAEIAQHTAKNIAANRAREIVKALERLK